MAQANSVFHCFPKSLQWICGDQDSELDSCLRVCTKYFMFQDQTPASDNPDTSAEAAASILSSVRGVIAICGVFHIGDHYRFEARRGVEDLSGMWRAMEGLSNFDKHSPLLRLQALDSQQITRQVLEGNAFQYLRQHTRNTSVVSDKFGELSWCCCSSSMQVHNT